MGEFGKQIFALLAFIIGAAAGIYVGYLTYYNQIMITAFYGLGGSYLNAGIVGFAIFLVVAGVLYKTVHPF